MSIIFKLCHGTLKNQNCLSKSSGDTEKKNTTKYPWRYNTEKYTPHRK